MEKEKHVFYTHKVNYYETDKMGITHHSNYIRFMEEARLEFLKEIGYPMQRIEAERITSPVTAVSCEYKRSTTYDDLIEIDVSLKSYNGVVLTLSYIMRDKNNGDLIAKAESSHCFIRENGLPIAVKKHFPGMDEVLKSLVPAGKQDRK